VEQQLCYQQLLKSTLQEVFNLNSPRASLVEVVIVVKAMQIVQS